jgi:hypothetical protein
MVVPDIKQTDERCEDFLNPAYYDCITVKQVDEQNAQILKSFESTDSMDHSQRCVIFGSPERCYDLQKDKQYMTRLYGSLRSTLKEKKDRGILLLGPSEEGINSLIYRIISEPQNELTDMSVLHIVATDENIHNLQDPNKDNERVFYQISDKKRQEAHIGYVNWIQEKGLSDIMMFGGTSALWSDIKIAMADRRVSDGSKLGDCIRFYEDGFDTTRSSSVYAKGVPKERCILADSQANGVEISPDIYKTNRYYEKVTKTSTYHRDLAYGFKALINLLKEKKIVIPDLELSSFLRAFNPINLLDQDADVSTSQEDSKSQTKDFFEQLFIHEKFHEISAEIEKLLGPGGYKILIRMDAFLPKLSLREKLRPQQPASELVLGGGASASL